jgi:hypothetical protein
MDLKTRDAHLRMPLTEVLAWISSCYSRKCVADYLDDKERVPRLSLADFVYIMVLEDTQNTKEAFEVMCRVVANVELYCSLGMSAFVCVCVYIYIYIYILYLCVCIYI